MHSTEAIVLRKIGVGEQDAVYSLFTRKYGKVRALARGVRREQAKLRGHLEPISETAVEFILTRRGERLIGATLLNPFSGIRADTEKMRLAWYITEVIHRYWLSGSPDEAVWNILTTRLQALDHIEFFAPEGEVFVRVFEQKFLAAAGFAGEKDIRVLGIPFGIRPV